MKEHLSHEAILDRWNKKCEEIKKQAFDEDQCTYIRHRMSVEYLSGDLFLQASGTAPRAIHTIQALNDLDMALAIAYSNFRAQKRGFWSRIFGGKKEVNLFKYK